MRCVSLRCGDGDPLFVFPGAGGEAEEQIPLAAAMRHGRPVVAVLPFESLDDEPQSVDSMAESALALIKERQWAGPYWLLGYSFGGLLALETARVLRSRGEEVRFVGLIDAIYDRRYWQANIFLAATLRRTAQHMGRIAGQPSIGAFREIGTRAGRLAMRVSARRASRPPVLEDEANRQQVNLAAMATWRPRRIDGTVHLFTTGSGGDFGCDPARLWRPWVDDLVVRRLPGAHLDLVRNAGAVRALARAVDSAIKVAESPPLKALVATTFRWEQSGRLAAELSEAGWAVEAVAPASSVLHRMARIERSYPFSVLAPLRSLANAIETSRADVIVPFDDRTRRALHEVYQRADPETPFGARIRERLEMSLGRPDAYATLYDRAATMAIAAEAGLLCPHTTAVHSVDEAIAWMARNGAPAVLKTDGSWGGREVVVVHTIGELSAAWKQLSRPPGLARILKRLVVERDPWPLRLRLRGRVPSVSIQTFIAGRPGTLSATSVRGELLGAVQAEVVQSDGALGPSTVVQIFEHPDMIHAARTMLNRLGLTGLCGLDFVLEARSGRAWFIELNPRATPTCHLMAADGTDLLASLSAALGRRRAPTRGWSYPDGLVALFPQEMRRDPASMFLTAAYHDVPHHTPELVRHALAHNGGR